MESYIGRTLGDLQSVTSPYFSKRHIPEAYLIQATTFFYLCQWDRVKRALGKFKEIYDPMTAQVKDFLKKKQKPYRYYEDVVNDGNGKFSVELAREVRRSKRFKDY